ncbi:MAG: hypothetical protein JXL97_01110 [Bacteroidales bacterium]|nr:hypothetical protein [Bacteroidales bacterium]
MKWDLAQEHHFETVSNNYENNKEHAFSIFNIRNSFINQDYAENSPQAKRMKQVFEEYAEKEFEKNWNGETSFNLLLELYGNIKNFRH